MPIFPADPNERWKPITFTTDDTVSAPLNRDPNLITAIVKELGVTTNARYLPANGATYCKTFAEDFCQGMTATFPHWVTVNSDGQGGAPCDPGKGTEVNINLGVDWLDRHGADYGWEEITGDLLTQILAASNAGNPVLAVWKNPKGGHGHVMIPLPSFATTVPDLAHLPCAQAGLHNFEAGTLAQGFGPLIHEVRFFQAP